MLDGRPIPAENIYSKKKNNNIIYASYGSKVDTSGISVKISDDMIKNNAGAGVDKLKQSQKSGRKNAGTKTVHNKEEAKEAFKQQEQASKEINQMNKDLKTKQQELQKATESGKFKLTDEQKKQLEAKRNRAAKAVNAGSNTYRKSATGVLGKLEAGARKLGKFFGI
jgi:membrane protein involved in colicin uptake